MPIATLALVLRPVDAGAESEECEITEVAVPEGERGDVRDTAPKTVGIATLTNWVVFASAMCTANEPFSPQIPQSGTLRCPTNHDAAADEYSAGFAVAVAGLATE